MSAPPPSPAPTGGDIAMASAPPAAGGDPTIPPHSLSSSGDATAVKSPAKPSSSLGSACDSHGDDGGSKLVDATSDESVQEVEGHGPLCAVICDILFDVPKSSFDAFWYTFPTFAEVLTKCNWNEKKVGNKIHDRFVLVEDTLTIDMRAKCAADAIRNFKNDLIYCSRILCLLYPLRYLNVIVGCKQHGVGKGKLKQAVIDVLEMEGVIKWKEDYAEGSVISIEFDEKKEVLVKATQAKVDIFPCTVICDFLFDLPKSSFGRFWRSCPTLAEELNKCCHDEEKYGERVHGSYIVLENTLPIDLRAYCGAEAIEAFKTNLYYCSLAATPVSSIKCVEFIVGCKVHGVGKGKLKQALIDVLEMEDDFKWSEECAGGSVISIKLDGRNNFNFLGDNFNLPRFI